MQLILSFISEINLCQCLEKYKFYGSGKYLVSWRGCKRNSFFSCKAQSKNLSEENFNRETNNDVIEMKRNIDSNIFVLQQKLHLCFQAFNFSDSVSKINEELLRERADSCIQPYS